MSEKFGELEVNDRIVSDKHRLNVDEIIEFNNKYDPHPHLGNITESDEVQASGLLTMVESQKLINRLFSENITFNEVNKIILESEVSPGDSIHVVVIICDKRMINDDKLVTCKIDIKSDNRMIAEVEAVLKFIE